MPDANTDPTPAADDTGAPTPPPGVARPDALIIPESMKRGATKLDRIDSICRFAEPILGGDRAAGRTAFISPRPHGKLFVRLDQKDKMYFPTTGPNVGPRYHWVEQPNGIEYGYLVDAAKEEKGA